MNKFILFILLSILLLPFSVLGKKDEHGCYGEAGYVYCERLDKCMRWWENEYKDLYEMLDDCDK